MAKPVVVKVSDVQPMVPLGHTNTSSWTLIGKDQGATNVAVFLTEMRPGAVASEHKHPAPCDHVYFIISGRGRMKVEDVTIDIEPNMAIFVPADTPHETITVGEETLRFIVLSAPPAPIVLTK